MWIRSKHKETLVISTQKFTKERFPQILNLKPNSEEFGDYFIEFCVFNVKYEKRDRNMNDKLL